MKNDRKQYISPSTIEQTLQNSGVLCASGGGSRISSNINVHGGDNGGDAAAAF